MAHAGFPASPFKPETIEYVIATIKNNWSDRSPEKLEELFDYLQSKGVKSEGDVASINEAELSTVIGLEATRRILQHFENLDRKEKAPDRCKEQENTYCKPEPETATDHTFERPSGHSEGAAVPKKSFQHLTERRSDMAEMFQMFMQMQERGEENNRKLITTLQEGMQRTIDKLSATMMSTMKQMNERITEQMGLQQQLVEKLAGKMENMEARHFETVRHSQEWMERTQKMNDDRLNQLTRKVNAALESNQDAVEELKAAFRQQHEAKEENSSDANQDSVDALSAASTQSEPKQANSSCPIL